MSTVSHERGDLFEIAARDALKDYAIAHCISEDCAMGKGIAAEFKKRFAGVDELKQQVAAGKKTGTATLLERDGRVIFYLITKRSFYNKPTYESLKSSVEDMAEEMARRGISGCVMPRIGCGLDRLQWEKVEEIVAAAFAKHSVNAVVCSL